MSHDMSETIREAIRASGLAEIEIARRASTTAGQINRFMRGERTLTLPIAERVCRVLGLKLVSVPKKKGK